jgi:hypothetical protein
MSFISVYPGTPIVDEQGKHVCDENGFAIQATEFKTVPYDADTFERLCSSNFRTELLGSYMTKVTLCDTGLKNFKKGLLLMKSTLMPEALEVATRQEVTSHTLWQIANDVDFTDKLVRSQKPKKVKVKRAIPVMEEIVLPGSATFDVETGQYVVSSTPKKEYKPVMETIQIKDENGNVLREESVPKMQIVEVEEDDPKSGYTQEMVPNLEQQTITKEDGTEVVVKFKKDVQVIVLSPQKISDCISACDCEIAKDKLTRLVPNIQAL